MAAVAEAVSQATSGRPGPVLLALAEDLLDEIVPAGSAAPAPRAIPQRPTDDEVRDVLQLLSQAERPVILAGAGVLRARTSNDLLRLAELLRVPVIASWRRGDVISNDHPLYLGMAGYGSPSVVRERLAGADAMLVIGSRLGEITSFGWTIPGAGTRWAHVDLAPQRPDPDLRRPTSRSPRTPGCSSGPPYRGSRAGASSTPSTRTPEPRRMPRTAPRGRPRRWSTITPGPARASTRDAS